MNIVKHSVLKDPVIIVVVCFDSGSLHGVAEVKPAGTDKQFRVPRISLVADAVLIEADYAIQYSHLLVAIVTLTQVAFHLELNNLFEAILVAAQAIAWPQRRKVVAMYDDCDLELPCNNATQR